MTAAGNLKPAKVVIMGAGVAGLQAIATAKRLGAIGKFRISVLKPKNRLNLWAGKFIMLKGDASVKLEGKLCKKCFRGFSENQQALIAKHISEADLVITTALIPGKKAPVLVTEDMVKAMKMGSVIVDMAVEQGGNCTLSELNKQVVKYGVTIIGEGKPSKSAAVECERVYARTFQLSLLIWP